MLHGVTVARAVEDPERGDTRAGALNISAPDLEERMPAIADWFMQRHPDDAHC